jgi:peptidoglycan/LPS O-acetylase OafA/YrhL
MTFILGILAWLRGWFERGSPILRPLFWSLSATASGGLFLGLKLTTNVQASVTLKLVNALLHNGFALTAMLALISIFSLLESQCDPVGRYLGELAYGVYWIHMPVVMILAWFCRPMTFSPFVKYALVVGVGTIFSLMGARQIKRLPWVGKCF